ncbi:hypothetical protein CI109_107088 [Kwoniella shandongensis]|uniref:Uncharacterized protein n=1 Tax=Kwoniella shandongensis TaxID=1734106 RepID=A0AAJ8MYX7_9TREE
MGVPHRILCEDDDNRWWPYPTSPERIQYLADARNRVLEPLQSDNATIRLPSYDSYTKIVFLNDIRFSFQSIVRLLATRLDGDASKPGEYDLACGMDFGAAGLYDTWVARDVCGTPMRAFWPFVKDELSVQRIMEEKPLEVATCWNGVVAFPSDTFPGSRQSPPIELPLKFRSSALDACDHSESFLFGYDLHRLYHSESRPPRIIMNPSVRVAYQENWFRWHNGVLRMPIIRWWLNLWSRGVPLVFVNWLWEAGSTRRDHCTWSALQIGAPARCPKLPEARQRGWGASG